MKYLPSSRPNRGIFDKIPAAWVFFFVLGWTAMATTAIAFMLIVEVVNE